MPNCEKCGYSHAEDQAECYRCEKCGCKVKQIPPNDDPFLDFPLFDCENCGHRHLWD